MSNTNETAKQDVYTRITNQIIAALEEGVKPWTQPWNAAHAAGHVSRPLRHNGQPYAGINVLTLWASAMSAHYAAPIWMTFKQAIELGGCVRKGEKGSPVVYANTMSRTETDEATGDEAERTIPFLKAYTVFNVEQVDGLPAHFYARAEHARNPDERIADAEAFFNANNVDVVKDFSTAQADIIDLTDILGSAYNPLVDAIADFVSFSESSGSTFVSVDRDGTAGVYSMAQIIKLESVTGLASAATLETNGNLIAA